MIVYIILYAITISHGLYLHNPRNLRFSQSTFRSYLFLWFISIAQRSVYDIHPSTKDHPLSFNHNISYAYLYLFMRYNETVILFPNLGTDGLYFKD